MAKVIASRRPFDIEIEGFGRFDNEDSIFYAHIKPSVHLTELADDILAAVSDLRGPRSRTFIPHATLATPTSLTVVNEYFRQTISDIPHLSFQCENFSLLLLDEQAHEWKVIHTFSFRTK